MVWWLVNSTRFLREIKLFEEVEAEADWLGGVVFRPAAGLAVEVDFEITVYGRSYAATLTYPDLFPETPAYICPRDSSEQWSSHQYGPGGSLCLESRADNWDPNVTGVDLVKSAHKLLATERNPEQPARVLSAHHVTLGQETRSSNCRLVCTSTILEALTSLPESIAVAIGTNSLMHLSTLVTFVSKIADVHGTMCDIADLPPGIKSSFPLVPWTRNGQIFKRDTFRGEAKIRSFADLVEMIRGAGFTEDALLVRETESTKYQNLFVLVVGTDPRSLRAYAIGGGEQQTLQEYKVIFPDTSSPRLPIDHAKLADLRFGIVGLGSMGSKIAISLARSGAHKFLLIDDDLLIPGNLSRHDLSWLEVGMHKAEGVKEALSLIAPGIEAIVHCHRVAGQESALQAASVLKDLGKCDLLIDATANPEVFLRMAAIAKISRRPLFWGELYAGGFGGMIARARPHMDPNPLSVRAAVANYLEQQPPAPFKNNLGYDVEGQQPLIAYDSEIAQIASALTRFIIDGALQRNPSEFPCSAYLIGLRKEWIFSQPFDTQPIQVTGAGWDSDDDPVVIENDRNKAVQFLLESTSKGQRANSDSES